MSARDVIRRNVRFTVVLPSFRCGPDYLLSEDEGTAAEAGSERAHADALVAELAGLLAGGELTEADRNTS